MLASMTTYKLCVYSPVILRPGRYGLGNGTLNNGLVATKS